MVQPAFVVFEAGAFRVFAKTCPEPPLPDRSRLAGRRRRRLPFPSRARFAGLPPRQANASRGVLFFQLASPGVITRVGNTRQAVDHCQRKEHCRIVSKIRAGIALLDAGQRHTADGGRPARIAKGMRRRAPRIADVVAESPQGAAEGLWNGLLLLRRSKECSDASSSPVADRRDYRVQANVMPFLCPASYSFEGCVEHHRRIQEFELHNWKAENIGPQTSESCTESMINRIGCVL